MERRTKTSMFKFEPSLYAAFKKIAHMQDTPMNEIVHKFIQKYVDDHAELIKSYDDHIVH